MVRLSVSVSHSAYLWSGCLTMFLCIDGQVDSCLAVCLTQHVDGQVV